MYGSGRADQETIRRLFPDVSHCKWLRDSPSACDALPFDVGNVKAGCPCPNNPYVKFQDLIDEQNEQAPILEESLEWQAVIDLGIVPSIKEITAIQFCFASAVRRFTKAREAGAKLF